MGIPSAALSLSGKPISPLYLPSISPTSPLFSLTVRRLLVMGHARLEQHPHLGVRGRVRVRVGARVRVRVRMRVRVRARARVRAEVRVRVRVRVRVEPTISVCRGSPPQHARCSGV